jgi:hypothetical protein
MPKSASNGRSDSPYPKRSTANAVRFASAISGATSRQRKLDVHRAGPYRDSQQIGVDGNLLVARGCREWRIARRARRSPEGTLTTRAPPVKVGIAKCTPRAAA